MQQVHVSVHKQSQSSHRPWLKHTYTPTHTHAHTHHDALISSLHIEICRLKEKQTALKAYIYQQYEKKLSASVCPSVCFHSFSQRQRMGLHESAVNSLLTQTLKGNSRDFTHLVFFQTPHSGSSVEEAAAPILNLILEHYNIT